MFRKLKIKLVLINLTLICIVLLLVFVGINWYVNKGAEERAQSILHTTLQNIDRLRNPSIHDGRISTSPVFYVLTSKNGQATEASPNAPVAHKAIATLALQQLEDTGKLTYNQSSLWYLKAPQDNSIIVVFLQDEGGNALLGFLTDISLTIGFVSMLLALVISIILANRALLPIHIAWEKQQTFVADASHELRTPLAVLHTNLEVIMDSPSEKVVDQSQWLINMQNEIARMSKLVEDLLFLARADAKSGAAPATLFSLSNLLETVSMPFLPFLKEKNFTFEQHIEPDIEMKGVESRIRQLIIILLDNAIKNTHQQGRISLSLRTQNDRALIEIADTGIGIPAEQLSHIFERFYRTDQSRTRTLGGAGLGLSIAECIINEHKGSINVQSQVGIGTVFNVIFPKA